VKANPFDVITLCYKCKRSFEEAGNNVRRVSHKQISKDTCDLCSVKSGYDYKVTSKKKVRILR